jgi:hypothetical protein
MCYLVVALFHSGCAPAPLVSEEEASPPKLTAVFHPNARFYFANEPVQLQLELTCPRCPGRVPAGFQPEVFDTDNLLIPSTAALGGATLTVSFTAGRPGTYHVVVDFEPNLGSFQVDLLVVRRRAYRQLVELPADCAGIDRAPSGAWMCNQATANSVLIFRGTQQVARFDGKGILSGSSLWVLRTFPPIPIFPAVPTLTRYQLTTDDGAVEMNTTELPRIDRSDPLASESELLGAQTGGIVRYVAAPGKMLTTATLQAPWQDATSVMMLREGKLAWAVFVPSTVGAVCPYDVSDPSTLSLAGKCEGLPSRPIGREGQNLWLAGPVLLRPANGVLRRVGGLAKTVPELAWRGPGRPVAQEDSSPDCLVPSVEREEIVVEHFPLSAGFFCGGATEQLVWERRGVTRIWERAPL